MVYQAEAESLSEQPINADNAGPNLWNMLPKAKGRTDEEKINPDDASLGPDVSPPEPEKIVKRKIKFGQQKQQGRSLSVPFSQASTIETDGQGLDSRRTSKLSGRMSSKTSVESADSRLTPRPGSGQSRVLQSGGSLIMMQDRSLRRPSTIEAPPTNSLDVGSLTGRSSSLGAISRRSSKEEASGYECRRKSTLDMSPRTARRYLIHKHRMSMEGNVDEPHHRPRRGSFLGAESMAVIAKLEGKDHDEDEDPRWCGFFRDDRVTTKDGPDADGPWKDMGVGWVEGPAEKQKGFLRIYFQDAREAFNIRAHNLFNLTDPKRSGKYARSVEEKDNRYQPKAYSRKQGATRAAAGAQRLIDVPTIEAQEPTTFTFRDGLESAGLQVGDLVGSFLDGRRFAKLGTVIKEGDKAGEVFVRVGDLGIRSFEVRTLAKMEPDEERDNVAEAHKASYVNPKLKKRHTLTLDEATLPFSEGAVEKSRRKSLREICAQKDAESAKKEQERQVELAMRASSMDDYCWAPGDFVKIKDSVEGEAAEVWKSLGIGMIRCQGKKPGTVEVQFDSGAEHFPLFVDQLEKVPRKHTTDRAFRCTNQAMLRRRGSI